MELPCQWGCLCGSLNAFAFEERSQSIGILRLDRDILLLLRQAPHENHRASGFEKIDVRNGIQVNDFISNTYESRHISHPALPTQQRCEITELFLHQFQRRSGERLNGEPRAAGDYGAGNQLVLLKHYTRERGPGEWSRGEEQVVLFVVFSNHVFQVSEIDRYHVSSLRSSRAPRQYIDC